MRGKIFLTGGLALTAMLAAAPANASLITFDLSGSRNATFTLESSTPTSFSSSFIGDQVAYNNIAGSFNGAPGIASINFGTFLVADLNIGGTSLGFTQFAGPDLFTGLPSNPIFNLGTFNLTSIVSGSSTLRISQAAVPSAVPEPATWAMMLVGFGMVGAATRYRRRKTAVAFA